MPNSGPGRARGSECLGGCEIAGEGSFDVLATLCLQSGETAVMGRIHRSLNVGAIRSALPLAEPLAAHAVPGGHAPPTPRHSSGPVLAGDWPLSRDHPTSEEPRPPPRLAPPGAPQQPAPQAAERHEEGTQQRERLRLTHKPDHWQHLSPAPPSTSALEGARAAANKKKPCAQMCDGYSVGRSPLSAVFGMLESASGGPLQARRCPMRVVLAWRAGRLLAAVPRGGLVPERLRPPEPDGCGPATRLVVWASLRTACGGPGDAAVLRISSINRFTVVGLGSVASLSSFVADSSGEQAGDAAQVLSLVLQVRHESAPWGDGELDSVAGAERQITEVAAHNDPIGVGISDANRWRRSGSDEADKEYCDGGTAFDLIHNQDIVVMSWVQRWKMAMDVAQAMHYLHSFTPQIIHRDLKSLNLLFKEPVVNCEDLPETKVVDFGQSRMQHGEALDMTKLAGTPHWMAPEVFQTNSYDRKVDVYSYSMILYEIICSEIPFEEIQSKQRLGLMVCSGGRPDMKAAPPDCPEELLSLMACCWDGEPANRPDFDEIAAMLSKIYLPSGDYGAP
ncbi:unnamed protein product [Prorocentrum cordatum]|uniref:Protein kinase domain-containing protein n=1 Tax=Prorocentrum cordatum TaxID=2364126 RepID=A0ABN9TUA1_9DINO|nr:unnamed protein product [Polarella glacialis]